MFHIENHLNFLWIHLDALLSNQKSEELANGYTKCIFTWIQLHLMSSEGTKGFILVLYMVRFLEIFYEHIVNINLYISLNLIIEDFIEQSLLSCSSIFYIERHHFVIIDTFLGHKGYIFLILKSYPDLIISREGIHEA